MPSKRFIAALVAGGLAISSAAHAQQFSDSYVALSGGVSLLMDSDNEGAFVGAFTTGQGTTIPAGVVLDDGTAIVWNTEFDTGYMISAAYGREWEMFRGEVEVSWQRNGVDRHTDLTAGVIELGSEDAGVLITGSPNIGVPVSTLLADGQGAIRTIFVMANAIYDFELNSPITPYAGGGLGVGFVNVDFSPSNVTIVDDTSIEFAWQVKAGAAYEVSPQADLFAGVRFRTTTKAGVETGLFPADLDVENKALLIEAGLRWAF